jgi:hypothetical protein
MRMSEAARRTWDRLGPLIRAHEKEHGCGSTREVYGVQCQVADALGDLSLRLSVMEWRAQESETERSEGS